MTIRSVWATNAKPANADRRQKEERVRKNVGALTFAHKKIELITNHYMGQSFGNILNNIKSEEQNSEFPDILLLSNFGSLRSIKDAIFNASQDICINNKPVRKTIDAFFDDIVFPEFHATHRDRKQLTKFLNQHKKHMFKTLFVRR